MHEVQQARDALQQHKQAQRLEKKFRLMSSLSWEVFIIRSLGDSTLGRTRSLKPEQRN
jgi:hypothetical protein